MLRLEHLFDRLGQLIRRDAAVDHHFALVTVFEIMDVASRADLKSDLLKELERLRPRTSLILVDFLDPGDDFFTQSIYILVEIDGHVNGRLRPAAEHELRRFKERFSQYFI
jgi:hypothetical protein